MSPLAAPLLLYRPLVTLYSLPCTRPALLGIGIVDTNKKTCFAGRVVYRLVRERDASEKNKSRARLDFNSRLGAWGRAGWTLGGHTGRFHSVTCTVFGLQKCRRLQ